MSHSEHIHHAHPSRCCPAQDPAEVLSELKRNPPVRMGFKSPHGWSGETQEAFASRIEAWEGAMAREEELLRAKQEK